MKGPVVGALVMALALGACGTGVEDEKGVEQGAEATLPVR